MKADSRKVARHMEKMNREEMQRRMEEEQEPVTVEQMLHMAEIFEARLQKVQEEMQALRYGVTQLLKLQEALIHVDYRSWITYECLERLVKGDITDINSFRETASALAEEYAKQHNSQNQATESETIKSPKNKDGVEEVVLG